MAETDHVFVWITNIQRVCGFSGNRVPGGGEAAAPGFTLVALDLKRQAMKTWLFVDAGGALSTRTFNGEEGPIAEGNPCGAMFSIGVLPPLKNREPQHIHVKVFGHQEIRNHNSNVVKRKRHRCSL